MLGRHIVEETAAQREVLGKLVEQEKLLARHDVNGLKQSLMESDPILARLQALIEARMRILNLFGRRLGVPAESVSVSLVLESTGAAEKNRLNGHAAELRKLLKDVERRTRRVNVMLRYARETDHAILHALLGEQAPLRPYQPDGRRVPSSGMPHFARDI
jgi:hypothetical protein